MTKVSAMSGRQGYLSYDVVRETPTEMEVRSFQPP